MMTETEQVLWIRQVRDYGLGNTICMTPGLREMSARLGQRIPMFFETEGLGGLFADCPFIDVMAGPIKHCHAKYTSWKPERLKGESDYMAWSRILNRVTLDIPADTLQAGKAFTIQASGSMGAFRGDTLHTQFEPYVDACEPPDWWHHPKGKTVAIAHGCLSENPVTIAQKDVGVEVRQRMFDAVCEAGATPVIIGNERDELRFWSKNQIFPTSTEIGALGVADISLRRAVGIMQKCDAFITNATGLYHVGAASGMTGLVLWKDCSFEKNVAPSKNVSHANQGQWGPSIDKFVKKVMA